MVIVLKTPPSVYAEQLEEWLLLQALHRLWREQGHLSMPPAMALAVRNDLVQWAIQQLDDEGNAAFQRYVEQLQHCLPTYRPVCFPRPDEAPASTAPAEVLAHAFLQQDHGSLWTALKQVVALLPFEDSRRTVGRHRAFAMGAYGHRGQVGLLRNTRLYTSVGRLANALVLQWYPTHMWTTVTFNVNLEAAVHIDSGNAASETLVIGLSHFDEGQLWIADRDGTHYQEHGGKMISGEAHRVSGEALLFPAYSREHAVLPWAVGDRITLVAHVIGTHTHLKEADAAVLLEMGFGLPQYPCPAFPMPYVGS